MNSLPPDVLELYRRHVNAGYARLASMMNLPIEASSHGNLIEDSHGQAYLDAGGYGVFLLGHGHPQVVAAVSAQLHRHAMASKLLINADQAHAAALLSSVCPPDLDYVFFCNSGAEATEAALKLARMNGCARFISTHGGYHGKTLGALSVTGRETYREPFQAALGACAFVPFGDLPAIAQELRAATVRCCVIVEPVQAEAGVILPPPGYLQGLRELCDETGALLIFDEIQSGMGRTGNWWASYTEGVTSDILLVGKSLSGGCVPVSAMVATASVQAPLDRNPLMHTSTFAANPLAMAAVQATLRVMLDEQVVELARDLGERLRDLFHDLLETPGAKDIVQMRCAGLLIGFEFKNASMAAQMVMFLLERHIIVCHSLNDHRVIRLTPSAFYSQSDVEWLLSGFTYALTQLLKEQTPS